MFLRLVLVQSSLAAGPVGVAITIVSDMFRGQAKTPGVT